MQFALIYNKATGPSGVPKKGAHLVTYPGGDKEWYLNGVLHRTDGPAIECGDGHKAWYQDGQRHRLDGPAVEWKSGAKAWWINGIKFTEEEWETKRIKYILKGQIV